MIKQAAQPFLTVTEFLIYAVPVAFGLTISTLSLPRMMFALGAVMACLGVLRLFVHSDESETMILVSLFPLGGGALAFAAGIVLRLIRL